jgi:hypothetical protein
MFAGHVEAKIGLERPPELGIVKFGGAPRAEDVEANFLPLLVSVLADVEGTESGDVLRAGVKRFQVVGVYEYECMRASENSWDDFQLFGGM